MDKDISRKLQALLEMSRRGTEHERPIAAERLQYFLEKYDLTIGDIDPQNTHRYGFSYRNKYEKRLLFQVRQKVTNDDTSGVYWQARGKREVELELTKAQYIEALRLYVFYCRELKTGMERFFAAFIHANHIFGESSSEPMQDIDEETLAMLALASAIQSKQPCYLLESER